MSEPGDHTEFLIERPPSLNYLVRPATPEELKVILSRLKEMGRQTMNFRTNPGASALVMFDLDQNNKLIGWQGFSIGPQIEIPEKYSLHLEPDYRSFLLGLALETVFYKHLHAHGVESIMLRLNELTTKSLMEYRTTTGIMAQVPREQMPQNWLDMCHQCELFGQKCPQQVFFKVDVKKGIEFGEKRLGQLISSELPVEIKLVPGMIRKNKRTFSPKWAA